MICTHTTSSQLKFYIKILLRPLSISGKINDRAEIRVENRIQTGIIVNITSPISVSSKIRKDIDHSNKKLCSPS
jgi:hypothetical protein